MKGPSAGLSRGGAETAVVLGVESSCDDMAVALVQGGTQVLASVVHSQDAVHADYGGVVPELASRDHVRHVCATTRHALERAGRTIDQVDAVAVTAGPGLIGSLLVGVCFAKALAYRARKPLVAVHHIEGHLASARLGDDPLAFPFLGVVVSGGHSAFYAVEGEDRIRLLGQTRDDAAGEAFDKLAKRMGLGYPGGREIDRRARSGRRDAYALPRPMLKEPGLELSFSGLKTAAALEIERLERTAGGALGEAEIDDLSASFQEAVADVLVEKTRRGLERTGYDRVALVGGLAANSRLRERIGELAGERDVEARFPPVELCTDNAAMVAAVGHGMWRAGRFAGLDLEAFSRVPLGEVALSAR